MFYSICCIINLWFGVFKMLKEQISDLKIKELVHKGQFTSVCRLDDQRLLKVIDTQLEEMFKEAGESYEQRVIDTRGSVVDEIVAPLSYVYQIDRCCGFTMEDVNGLSLEEYCESLGLDFIYNLQKYADLFAKIEGAVRKANDNGIIMPDLCTHGNIMVQNDGKIRIIDYDGLQIKENSSITISTALGEPFKYLRSMKYSDGPSHFTSEIDKTGLTILMFLLVFNVDLTKVGTFFPGTRKMVTVRGIFEMMGCSDELFMQKVEDNLSDIRPGHYLADDLRRIASNYVLTPYFSKDDGAIKRLIRK